MPRYLSCYPSLAPFTFHYCTAPSHRCAVPLQTVPPAVRAGARAGPAGGSQAVSASPAPTVLSGGSGRPLSRSRHWSSVTDWPSSGHTQTQIRCSSAGAVGRNTRYTVSGQTSQHCHQSTVNSYSKSNSQQSAAIAYSHQSTVSAQWPYSTVSSQHQQSEAPHGYPSKSAVTGQPLVNHQR